MRLKRRFLRVGDRRVHYFRAGEGPPAVLVHSSPADARLLMKEIEQLAPACTVFAFDTPGFGLSDPLPGDALTVADLADAFAATLAALAMPPCPVFGTHTGAAIALEFGVRHPERVTGLVLDGVPAFNDTECARFFGDYFRPMVPSELGGHYAETWTRFRDQSIWFPWTGRAPDYLNPNDLSPPHSTHLWVSMFFAAADHYAPAYRAATYYGARALAATAALTVPAAFCATEGDMLFPHLARLPMLRPGQAIVPIGNSFARKRALIADRFASWGAGGEAPADRDAIDSTARVERQFIDGAVGQIHLRYAGDRASPPLLLLHDAPGSSEQLEPLIEALAARFFVVAPDLPGNGESDAFAAPPTLGDLAQAAAEVAAALRLERPVVHGVGFGAAVALMLAADGQQDLAALAVSGLPLPTPDEQALLRAHCAPPIAIEPDGAHWYRTWLMLRDMRIWWPWFDRRRGTQRDVAGDFDARTLHRHTLDVMRARLSYHHLIDAVLGDDAAPRLAALSVPLVQIVDSGAPSAAHDMRLAAYLAPAAVLRAGQPDLAAAFAHFVHASAHSQGAET